MAEKWEKYFLMNIEVHRQKSKALAAYFYGRKIEENLSGLPHRGLKHVRKPPEPSVMNHFHLMGSEYFKLGKRQRACADCLQANFSMNDLGIVLVLSK